MPRIKVLAMVMLVLLVSPVLADNNTSSYSLPTSQWNFVDNIVSGVNWLIGLVTDFISTVLSILQGLALIILYPVICLINTFYTILSNAYTIVVAFVNAIISIPNTVRTMAVDFVPSAMPSIWYTLFLMSLTVEALVQVAVIYAWAKAMVKWW